VSRKAFENTCNYAECEKKDNCVRYSEDGAYDCINWCAKRDFALFIKKETDLVVKGEDNGNR
jgi:hypothetical protein